MVNTYPPAIVLDSFYYFEGFDAPVWYAFQNNGAIWLIDPETYMLLVLAGNKFLMCDSWRQPLCDSGMSLAQLRPYSAQAVASSIDDYIDSVAASILADVDLE